MRKGLLALTRVRYGGLIGVFNMTEDQFQVLRRTRDGWNVAAAVSALVMAGVHRTDTLATFLSQIGPDVLACWLKDMHTIRMVPVVLKEDLD